MSTTTPLVDAAVNDTAFEDKNQPHTDWITAYAAREIEAKLNEAVAKGEQITHQLGVAMMQLNESHAREMQLKDALADRAIEIAGDQAFVNLFRETREAFYESLRREAQLRGALSDASSAIPTRIDDKLVHAYVREQFPATDGHMPLNEYFKTLGSAIANIAGALTLPAPPVVPAEDVKPLVDALEQIAHDGDDCQRRADDAISTFTAKHKL